MTNPRLTKKQIIELASLHATCLVEAWNSFGHTFTGMDNCPDVVNEIYARVNAINILLANRDNPYSLERPDVTALLREANAYNFVEDMDGPEESDSLN